MVYLVKLVNRLINFDHLSIEVFPNLWVYNLQVHDGLAVVDLFQEGSDQLSAKRFRIKFDVVCWMRGSIHENVRLINLFKNLDRMFYNCIFGAPQL